MYIKRTEQNVDIQQKKIGTVSCMLSLLSKENFFFKFQTSAQFWIPCNESQTSPNTSFNLSVHVTQRAKVFALHMYLKI